MSINRRRDNGYLAWGIFLYIYMCVYIYNIVEYYTAMNGASQVALVVKYPPANAGIRDTVSVPGSGRSPGGRHGKPLQYSGLENPMDRGTSWATVHRVAKGPT